MARSISKMVISTNRQTLIVMILSGLTFQSQPVARNAYRSNLGSNLGYILPSPKSAVNYNKVISNDNSFKVINEWKFLDFVYPTYQRRQQAISKGEFIPENNLPLGVDVLANRIFITTPRWKDGVPASLGWLSYPPIELSPPINPYPNWDEHGDPNNPDCNKLMSVYRISIDSCDRMWIIDSGIVNATVSLNQICPPKIVAYDLRTDKRVVNYDLPPDQIKQDSLHSNIIVDVRNGQCGDAYAYVTDVWRFGIVVYSLAKGRSWRVTNYNFSPNPMATDFNVYGLNFQWMDGVFGMSLSPLNEYNDRILYFNPMASYKEFMVSTEVIRDERLWVEKSGENTAKSFVIIGDRGPQGQSSTSGIDRNQVMFYTLIHQDKIGCWDTNKPYTRSNLGVVTQNSTLIQFPNDLKVDRQLEQGVWVMSNRLPIYLYGQLDLSYINFRILRASVLDAVKGTQCDPSTQNIQSVRSDPEECY